MSQHKSFLLTVTTSIIFQKKKNNSQVATVRRSKRATIKLAVSTAPLCYIHAWFVMVWSLPTLRNANKMDTCSLSYCMSHRCKTTLTLSCSDTCDSTIFFSLIENLLYVCLWANEAYISITVRQTTVLLLLACKSVLSTHRRPRQASYFQTILAVYAYFKLANGVGRAFMIASFVTYLIYVTLVS